MDKRILEYLQKPLLPEMCIVEQSIPVLFFGNIETATYATLGINPSKQEFLDKNDVLLSSKEKRFVDRSILQKRDDECLSVIEARKVYESLLQYFDESHNPYTRWFNVLNNLLEDMGYSYYNGSLVHLDITPWATNPTWNELDKKIKELLIDEGVKCLNIILESSKITSVLINGRSPMKYIENRICKMNHVDQLNIGSVSCEIKTGIFQGKIFIGWSTNLQSSFGVSTVFKSVLKNKVKNLLKKNSTPIST